MTRKRLWIWPVAGVGALAVFLVLLAQGMNDTAICSGTEGVTFTVTTGVATCGGDVVKSGVLPIGASLATKRDATVKLTVGGTELVMPGDSVVKFVSDKHFAVLAGHLAGAVPAGITIDQK